MTTIKPANVKRVNGAIVVNQTAADSSFAKQIELKDMKTANKQKLTTAAATAYIKDWMRYTSIKKLSETTDHLYFSAKTYPQQDAVELKVDRGLRAVGQDWDVYQRPAVSMLDLKFSVDDFAYDWTDAIPCTEREEE